MRISRGKRDDVTGTRHLSIVSAAFLLMVGGAADFSLAQTKTGPPSMAHTRYVIGKPYQFDGVWYRPAVDYAYDATGIASIYPPRDPGLKTTSGEVYDENAATAAHKTLPLPSIVRVTNLENGKTIMLRVNDRGPFVDSQIIQLSRQAAQQLSIVNQALVRVRVQVMAAESRALAVALGGEDVAPASAAPVPAVKVTALPLLNGSPVQPLDSVAASVISVSQPAAAPPAAPATMTLFNPNPSGVPTLSPLTPAPSTSVATMDNTGLGSSTAATTTTTQTVAVTDNSQIQLAALKSEAEASKAWKKILAKHNDLLGDLTAHIVRADLGAQGIYYRVQAGPFADKASAKAVCDKLKGQGQPCLVKP